MSASKKKKVSGFDDSPATFHHFTADSPPIAKPIGEFHEEGDQKLNIDDKDASSTIDIVKDTDRKFKDKSIDIDQLNKAILSISKNMASTLGVDFDIVPQVIFRDTMRYKGERKPLKKEFKISSDPKELGAGLAAARKAAGMTQKQVAEALQIDRAGIIRLERGQTNPTVDTLRRFSQAIGMKIDFSLTPED